MSSEGEVFKLPFSMVSTHCRHLSLIFLQNTVKIILSCWPVTNHQLPSEGCSDEKLLLFSLQRSWCPQCSPKWISTLHTRQVTMFQSYRKIRISRPEASNLFLEWPEPAAPEENVKYPAQGICGTSFPCMNLILVFNSQMPP